MFTYVPLNGMFYSPFGFAYWSHSRCTAPIITDRRRSPRRINVPVHLHDPGRVATGNTARRCGE
jgi:hypothetical protein